jgi:hypothetical protein
MKYKVIFFFILLSLSCNDETDFGSKSRIRETLESSPCFTNQVFELSDTSNFKIELGCNDENDNLFLVMYSGRYEDFEQEILNTQTILKRIERDYELEKLSWIEFYPLENHDLIKDIISVQEIRDNIEENKNEGYNLISQNIIEKFAYKSNLLKKFTDLFQKYNITPVYYTFEKCNIIEGSYKGIDITKMECMSLIISFKKSETS